jgi:hypothetical protein
MFLDMFSHDRPALQNSLRYPTMPWVKQMKRNNRPAVDVTVVTVINAFANAL